MGQRRGWGEHGLHQLGDGSWRAQVELGYLNGRRNRKYIRGRTRAEAKRKLNAFLETRRDADGAEPAHDDEAARKTVEELGTAWLRARKFSVRLSTLERQESILRCHVYPAIGKHDIREIVEEDITSILEALRGRLAPRTVVHVLVTVRSMFNYAVNRELVDKNPTAHIKRPNVAKGPPKYLEVEEIRRFFDAARGHEFEAVFLLALGHGLRLGEALGLRWSSINFDERMLSVDGSLVKSETGEYVVAATKTHRSNRPISLAPTTIDALNRRKAKQNRDRLAMGSNWFDSDLVFTDKSGRPLSKSNFTRTHHYGLVKKASIRRITFHGLRGAFATVGVQAGVPAKVMQEMLGHSTFVTTMDIYSHVLPEAARDAANDIATVMGL
jgi:integrase